jgi:hypothetical protein
MRQKEKLGSVELPDLGAGAPAALNYPSCDSRPRHERGLSWLIPYVLAICFRPNPFLKNLHVAIDRKERLALEATGARGTDPTRLATKMVQPIF